MVVEIGYPKHGCPDQKPDLIFFSTVLENDFPVSLPLDIADLPMLQCAKGNERSIGTGKFHFKKLLNTIQIHKRKLNTRKPMKNLDITIDDIEQELKRRQELEIAQFRAEIEGHRKAIAQIESLLAGFEESAIVSQDSLVSLETTKTFGPCATRILGILESSSVTIPAYKLASITKYSTPMLKKAIRELIDANRIRQIGDTKSPGYVVA